jgi:hypothetical protein
VCARVHREIDEMRFCGDMCWINNTFRWHLLPYPPPLPPLQPPSPFAPHRLYASCDTPSRCCWGTMGKREEVGSVGWLEEMVGCDNSEQEHAERGGHAHTHCQHPKPNTESSRSDRPALRRSIPGWKNESGASVEIKSLHKIHHAASCCMPRIVAIATSTAGEVAAAGPGIYAVGLEAVACGRALPLPADCECRPL